MAKENEEKEETPKKESVSDAINSADAKEFKARIENLEKVNAKNSSVLSEISEFIKRPIGVKKNENFLSDAFQEMAENLFDD